MGDQELWPCRYIGRLQGDILNRGTGVLWRVRQKPIEEGQKQNYKSVHTLRGGGLRHDKTGWSQGHIQGLCFYRVVTGSIRVCCARGALPSTS